MKIIFFLTLPILSSMSYGVENNIDYIHQIFQKRDTKESGEAIELQTFYHKDSEKELIDRAYDGLLRDLNEIDLSKIYNLKKKAVKNSHYAWLLICKEKINEFPDVITKITNNANNGNADAQNNLGIMYDNGYGCTQDYDQAFKWYKRAAKQGYKPAQDNLGQMYQNGYGCAQDYDQAFKWYKRAAKQGHLAAQHHLERISKKGYGVK